MTFTIRDGGEADIEGIARVHVQGWRETYKDFMTPEALAGLSVEERKRLWRAVLAQPDPRAKLLVAETDQSEIVGFVHGGPVRDKGAGLLASETEVLALYLLDKAKRQGIGRRLMRGVFHHLAAQGFRSVGLWVLKGNHPARSFYEALGGQAGAEQELNIRGQRLAEIAYRFEPIPVLD